MFKFWHRMLDNKILRAFDRIIHPPIPPRIQRIETDWQPKGGPEAKVYVARSRSANTPYRRWRKVRNQMAAESRRINRGQIH